ncbi:unnamed protein product [Aphanomyces euteiches]
MGSERKRLQSSTTQRPQPDTHPPENSGAPTVPLPALGKQRTQHETKVVPVAPPASDQQHGASERTASTTLPLVKRPKSVLQVSRPRKPGDVVLKNQHTIDLMLKYQMGQAELKKLKETFHYIDITKEDEISYEEFFEFVDEHRNPYSESLFKMIGIVASILFSSSPLCLDANGNGKIDFEEFVYALTMYCMFTREEILQFAFRTFDQDDSGTIDETEFRKLAEMVNDGKPLFAGNFNKALKDFDKKNDGVITFEGFDLLNRRYPMILFPCFQLQERIQRATLGEKHWLRIHERYYEALKDEQFRRRHGGAAPPVSTTTKLKLIFGVGTFEVYQPN